MTPASSVETAPSPPALLLAPGPVLLTPLGPVPDVAAIDGTAPVATLTGSKSQKLGKTVGVSIACANETCIAKGTGTVRVPKVG